VTETTGTNPEALHELGPVPADGPAAEHMDGAAHGEALPPGDPQQDVAPIASLDEGLPRDEMPQDGAGESVSSKMDEGEPAAAETEMEVESVEAEPVATEPVAEGPPRRAKAAAKSRKSAAAAVVEAPVADVPKSENMNWYILKVQSNREESIREGLLRRVSIQGLDRFFGEVIVPTEKVTEFKGGKKRVIKRKLYPGYLVVHMEINEDTWFLVRETPGIGDFTGASGVPSVMQPHEVERIIAKQEEKSEKVPDLKIPFSKGDRVKVIEGNFENFEGEVDAIDKTNGRVTVMITIFNRTTPVEFEYWQVESV
jgi:transcription termination/antitermination protein NusG